MSMIQDTIRKAVEVSGYEILLDKKRLCILLEDLSPTLREEREFIEKIYHDAVGKLFYDAYQADIIHKIAYIAEADDYLEEEFGYNEKWRRKLISYFEGIMLPMQSQAGDLVLLEKHTFAEWKRLAEQGNGAAQWRLGMMYADGEQTYIDLKAAVRWFEEAVNNGFTDAFCSLAFSLESGEGVKKNSDRAVRLYVQGVKYGSAACMRNLAGHYLDGWNTDKAVYVRRDKKRANELLRQAFQIYSQRANEGDPWAQYWCGFFYKGGMGIRSNVPEAIKWFELAAANGNGEAFLELGKLMYLENRTPEGKAKGEAYFKRASEFDNATIWAELGGIYDSFLYSRDLKKSFYWYQKAAERGLRRAQCSLGYYYYEGRGVEKDHRKAKEWYEKAAVQGDVNAQYSLGYMYRFGAGVEEDQKKAFTWFEMAAAGGNGDAQNHLGYMYRMGIGVGVNYEQALYWFRKSAAQNNSNSQSQLGYMYESGLGVEKDDKMSIEWYGRAARQGDEYSSRRLQELQKVGKF